MIKNKKDVFLINRTDEFLNEYIASYAERLKWISNFSGSAGRAIIEKRKAYIFIDGRYTNQIKTEINENYFIIKHINEYWSHFNNYQNEKILILDPSLHSISEINKIKKIIMKMKLNLEFLKENPIDQYWNNQPNYPNSKVFIHKEKYSGETSLNKIKKIKNKLKKNNIDYYILISLDSIAWLLNIRGNDIKYTPLAFCHIIIPKEGKVELFINKKKVQEIKDKLSKIVNINSFSKISSFIKSIGLKKIIGVDEINTSYKFEKICKDNKLILKYIENPCLYLKAVKNSTEIKGAKNANLRDGVSITKFLFWLKKIMKTKDTNELIASEYLLGLRKKNKLFYSLSFETISAIGKNAALPHYRVSTSSNSNFLNNKIYLVDSGAQYLDGTTDITRTIIIGTANKEQKDRFTRVLKGHIAIARAIININSQGSSIDHLSRKSLNEIGCDFDHGTGHGIGSFLSVHEGPQRISKSKNDNEGVMKKGMILSNEPGYYKAGEYGIRIENLILCCSKNKDYLFFDTISWAPIDIDLIEKSLLNKSEILWLNTYHKKVYDNISLNLEKNEREWLFNVTRPI